VTSRFCGKTTTNEKENKLHELVKGKNPTEF
jgi:hypothetical protein